MNTLFFGTIIRKKERDFMSSEHESKDPYTCTLAYDRKACGNCACATCYQQEFCDRCSSCRELSHKKEHCSRYEGAYNY